MQVVAHSDNALAMQYGLFYNEGRCDMIGLIAVEIYIAAIAIILTFSGRYCENKRNNG
jgi:hypothetical protein